ncbi:hypothetical protein [uncultured Selenomonas sp.]|uniref:hypothetical protein n=1 Tax=uncultured Selenomonas sp. TaxID=159275 RepID=UPI0028D6ABE2|nr:hypothetical protein [uncultured Selenomonas sp.]
MHRSRKKLRRIAALMLTPLILCSASCTEAAPAPAPQETAAAAATQVQQLSMEFRHPVADGTLMRMICLMDAPVKNVFPTEELAAKELDPESFITCLGEFVGKAFANGRYVDIRERYIPWTPELEASFHKLIADRNLAAENDFGARAETAVDPAYNIVVAYKSGRSLHITAADKTANGNDAAIEDAVLTWADNAFDTSRK